MLSCSYETGYPRSIVDGLLSGEHQIDRELAIALSDVIGASPRFWLQRQADYEVDRHVIPSHAVDGIKEWLETLPLADMGRLGWIPSTRSFNEKAIGCLQFFGVNSVEQWHERYSQELSTVAFRTSATLAPDVRSTAAWLFALIEGIASRSSVYLLYVESNGRLDKRK